jgi:hypothetical protein
LEVSLPGRILIQAFPEIEAFTAVKLPPKPEQEAASRLLPSSDCAVRADGMMPRGAAQPGEVILGYRTARFVQDSPSRRSTVWLSPDLGCVEVRTLMEFKDKAGNITDWSDQVVTSITKSVDPLMFSIPKSYELIDPEELFRRSIIHKKGVSPDEPFMGTLKSAADRFARYRFDPREP